MKPGLIFLLDTKFKAYRPRAGGKTVFEWLNREHPGRFSEGQIRTPQRRIQALAGDGRPGAESARFSEPDHSVPSGWRGLGPILDTRGEPDRRMAERGVRIGGGRVHAVLGWSGQPRQIFHFLLPVLEFNVVQV